MSLEKNTVETIASKRKDINFKGGKKNLVEFFAGPKIVVVAK